MSLSSWMADVKVSIFEATKSWAPFLQFGAGALGTITQLVPAMQMMGGLYTMVSAPIISAATATWGWVASTAASTWSMIKNAAVIGGTVVASFATYIGLSSNNHRFFFKKLIYTICVIRHEYCNKPLFQSGFTTFYQSFISIPIQVIL